MTIRALVVSTGLVLAVLVALGVVLMFVSSDANDDELRSGSYQTVEEAEKAVGFEIPHARELGAFRLKSVDVSGGTKVPGNVDPSTLDVGKIAKDGSIAILGSTRTEWGISLLYQAETDERDIVVSFGPRLLLAPSPGTGGEPMVHGQPVFRQPIPPQSPVVTYMAVRWTDTYGFIAWAMSDLPSERSPRKVTLQEFLDLVGSIR